MTFSINRWAKLAGIKTINEAEEKEVKLKTSIKGLAVGQFDKGDEKTIVLYDPEKMKEAILGENPLGDMPLAIMGMIRISAPVYGTGDENSCRGAWEVIRSGVRTKGSGVGGLLYQLAAAASPTGKIMPDRRDVSSDAQGFWNSKFSKLKPEKKKLSVLDDESNPRTEDRNDDCLVHDYDREEGPGSNVLNYAYDDLGAGIDIAALNSAHQDFMEDISQFLAPDVSTEDLFSRAASEAFHEMKN